MTRPTPDSERPVVLFDGVCNLCNAWVDFVIRHDPEGAIRFAPLQSEVADRLLRDTAASAAHGDTVVLLDEAGVWTESTAVLRIARRLERPYRLAWALRMVPRTIRDRVYRLVARSRYRWCGRRATCRAPTQAERDRFV